MGIQSGVVFQGQCFMEFFVVSSEEVGKVFSRLKFILAVLLSVTKGSGTLIKDFGHGFHRGLFFG